MNAKRALLNGVVLILCIAQALRAQEPANEPPLRFEVSARLGSGTLKIFGSDYKDSGLNAGFGIRVRLHTRVSVEFEGDRVLNLRPSPVPCAFIVPCSGSAVEGVRSASHFSGNLLYYLGTGGAIQPYVLGGLGTLRSRSAKAATFADATRSVIIQQADLADTGLSIGFGGGLRIPLSRHFLVRPEFRLYDATLRSRKNLSLIQTSIVIGYQFGQ